MRRQRRQCGEINLTPLLDVLFSILFIIMLTSARNETSIQTEAQDEIDGMKQEVADLENRVTIAENENQSYEMYEKNAVIITLSNICEGTDHIMVITNSTMPDSEERITLGVDRTENTATRLQDLIVEVVNETDDQPIYLVFHCDKYCIFTEEYRVIDETLNELEQNYKEIFYKMMEV